MNVQRHTVVYSCDGSYWEHAYVSLYSLLVNNQDLAFDVRVLASEPDQRFFANVQFLREAHSAVNISWLPANDPQLDDAPITMSYFTVATYYRLLLGRLLPSSVDRVLYLDADTVVRGSLRKLFDLDIGGYVLAATPNYFTQEFESVHGVTSTRLGLPGGSPYFNAGMLRINMNARRECEVGERCLEHIARSGTDPARIAFQDQDVLNFVLTGNWKAVGPHYNHVEWTMDPRRLVDFDPESQVGGVVPETGPAIAHYAHPDKPWNGACPHPYAMDYWRYRMQTPYADRFQFVRSWVNGVTTQAKRGLGARVRRLPNGEAIVQRAKHLTRA